MIETAIIIFFIALFKQYNVTKIFKHWSIYPIIATYVLHMFFICLMIKGEYWFLEYSKYIKNVSLLFYVFLILKYNLVEFSVFKNINLNGKYIFKVITSPAIIGIPFMLLGYLLNYIAIIFNNGKMPIFASLSYSTGYSKVDMLEKAYLFKDFHVFGSFNSNLIFLTDFIDISIAILSIGDVLARVFVGLVLYYSIKQSNLKTII